MSAAVDTGAAGTGVGNTEAADTEVEDIAAEVAADMPVLLVDAPPERPRQPTECRQTNAFCGRAIPCGKGIPCFLQAAWLRRSLPSLGRPLLADRTGFNSILGTRLSK